MSEEIVVIVDERNHPVGVASRDRMRSEGLLHRATFILVFDSRGRLFVQRRTATKDLYPGCWDLAAGGVVRSGESYEESAAREAAEELGLAQLALAPHFDFLYEDGRNRCWGRLFSCVHDGPFRLQAEEIEAGEFASVRDALGGRFDPVTPDTRFALERYLSSR